MQATLSNYNMWIPHLGLRQPSCNNQYSQLRAFYCVSDTEAIMSFTLCNWRSKAPLKLFLIEDIGI